jgi:hypothetical protein
LKEVRRVTVAPARGRAPLSDGPPRAHGRAARWSVWLSGVFAAAVAVISLELAFAGDTEWAGALATTMVLGGLAAVFCACALSIIAWVRGDHWRLLWVPLVLFPAVVAFLVLGEAFWWE